MQTIPGGVNSWYVDSVVVSKRVRTFLYSYLASLQFIILLYCQILTIAL
jgi:hypothetical protein